MRYPQAGLTLTKEQNKTREPLTESQTRAYTLSLSLTHTYKESPIHKNKKVQGTWACHTNTQAHTLRYVHTLSQTHAYTHTFTTNKETPKSSAYTRTRAHTHTHTRTYRRPDDCTSSFTSQPKPKNLSPIIWPVLGATGNPELPLSSGGDAGISAISPSLENKSLLVLPPSPCFQGSWG